MQDERSFHAPVKLLVTIVDRGKGEQVARIYESDSAAVHLVLLGTGTAKSEMMDFLGLDEPEKDIVLSMALATRIGHILKMLGDEMQFYKPGKGVAFSVPLSGINVAAFKRAEYRCAAGEGRTTDKEAGDKTGMSKQELIITVVAKGQTDLVMEAAKAAGARGGTVVRARGLDSDEAERFMKILIQPEKEVVFTLVPHALKQEVMRSISGRILSELGEPCLTIAVPVDEALGFKGIPDEV